ncbi:MAG: right-handed parallel beta-helix repeat-containing protein, partial [Thermoplasmata archaeon]|nr:right-handed parallel beta-helix repeat-containing protein [Thermoplasmata archaeon]
MARSVSPLMVLVFSILILSSIPMIVCAPVKLVETTTQRPDFFIGERIEAKMVVEYTGLPPGMTVTIEWFDPIGTPIFNETKLMTHYPNDNYAAAFSNWTATMTGINFTVRGTHIGTAISSEARFNVSRYEDSAVVETLSVVTSTPFYENNTMAKATTSLGYLGNGSRLGNVSFVWRYPNSTVAFTENVGSPDGGPNGTVEVNSTWQTDSVGTSFEVQATYNGVQPLTDTAYFDVIPERVKTWKNTSISGITTWAKNESPFGVCANITVQAGAALTVEAGSVIRFCPDAGMTIRGMLIMEGLLNSPIILTSHSYPSNPGDWKSVTFENESDDVGSSLNHVSAENSQRGFVFNSASPEVINVTVMNSSISGMEVYQSDILMMGVYLANSARGIYTSQSTLNLVYSEIFGCDDGIVMEDSDGWLEGNLIHDNIERGIWAVRSNPTIWGNVIIQNANKAIRIEGSQDVLIAENAIGWSNFTFDSFQSLGLTLRRNYFTNGAAVGLSFWTTDDVLVENSTIENSLASFRVAGGSIVRALNCTF